MKKFIKLIKFPVALTLCLMLAVLPGFGASVTLSPSAAATNNLVATAGSITSIVLSGAGAASVKVALFDAPTNVLTYVLGAYTNYTITVYTNTSTYVDILGGTNTNTFRYWTNLPATVAQSTNTYRTVAAFSVPTNETLTINYDTANPFYRGLLMTNSQAVTITVNYLPWR